MSNVLIFKNNEPPQYLESVNTPDYEGKPDVLINPNISLLKGVERKYWKRVGDSVEEMSIQEKKNVDDKEKLEKKNEKQNLHSLTTKTLAELLVSKGILTKKEITDLL